MTQFKHTPEQARALWVEGLRSGEYNQAEGVLCALDDEDRIAHCCLGVACEVYQIHEGDPLYIDEDKENGIEVRSYDGATLTLPEEVKDWLGLANEEGKYGQGNESGYSPQPSLAADNDKGIPFDRIADIIEDEPDGLFYS